MHSLAGMVNASGVGVYVKRHTVAGGEPTVRAHPWGVTSLFWWGYVSPLA